MKHIWKGLAALLVVSMMVLTFAGCGGGSQSANGVALPDISQVDAAATMQNVGKGMSDVKNIAAKMNIQLDMSASGVPAESNAIKMQMDMEMQSRKDPTMMHVKISGNMAEGSGGENIQTEVYLVPEGNDYAGYISKQENNTTVWEKQILKKEEVEATLSSAESELKNPSCPYSLSIEDFQKMLQSSTDLSVVGREWVNNVNALHIHGSVSFSDLMTALQQSGMMGSEANSSELNMVLGMFQDVTIPFEYYVDETTNRLVRASMDLKSAIDTLMSKITALYSGMASGSAQMMPQINVNQAFITMDITGYDDQVGVIQVPDEVIRQAKEISGSSSSASTSGVIPGIVESFI